MSASEWTLSVLKKKRMDLIVRVIDTIYLIVID